ncbi:threonine ammonia-lyase [Terricaulis silvestris]|uniref:L-threonine dehydratase catabolic TdcB n=1 Tax=Terricaulis silvestris TaxID=2686094 RepID=A0A6I6MM16_9CAUL|nr:threonine ammonia-lyase [Terricaulis silvestris]QGZ94024.1 L-threonine dehydratase catabolic TdcB [Terricaulis silvestris]
MTNKPAVTFADIQAAAERLKDRIERTETHYSRSLSNITGADVWVKYENHHETGAFKERGALNRLLQLTDAEKKRGVIAASAGNHAQAVAHHARALGVPTTIVMPKGTPNVKVEQTRARGATIVIEGETYDDAYAHALKLGEERNLVFVHPFNDAGVIAGQGTAAIEMLEDAPEIDVLIVPIGGGGLIAGMGIAAKAIKPSIQIYGVEPESYPSFNGKRRGTNVSAGGQTIAEGIAVKKIGDLSFELADKLVEDVILVDEPGFEQAIALYVSAEKTVAEGAGAASLAALLSAPEKFKGRKVGIVLSGGNIDTRILASVLERSMVRQGRIAVLRFIGDDRPGILATVSRIIGDTGGNILQVAHHRMALHAPIKGVEFDIEIETRDMQHTQEIVDALIAAGYNARCL